MGAGRNTVTINCREVLQYSYVPTLLRKEDLGGVIFGCTHSTMKECLVKRIFGLPAMHFPYVKNIEPGLPLFLFNYSDRKLYGIYEAASHGMININPSGWTQNGSGRTQFPAQVRVRLWKQCKALSEEQYYHILPKNSINIFPTPRYLFELDRMQTAQLIYLFECSAVTSSSPTVSTEASMNGPPQHVHKSLHGVVPNLETVDDDEDLKLLVEACTQHWHDNLEIPPELPAPAKKETSLFNGTPDTDARSEAVGVNQLALEAELDVMKPASPSPSTAGSLSSSITCDFWMDYSLLLDQDRLEDIQAASVELQQSICELERKLNELDLETEKGSR